MLHFLTALLSRPATLARLSLGIASLLSLASCKSTKGTASSDSLYASNHSGGDGGYRPYTGAQGGTVQATGHPQYEQAVPPPPPGYELPKEVVSTPPPAPKKSVASSSPPKKSTSSGTSTKAKTTSTAAKKKPTSTSGSYTVVKGDTLYGLALRKHTTVAKIKAASGISSDKLSIGQKLRIP